MHWTKRIRGYESPTHEVIKNKGSAHIKVTYTLVDKDTGDRLTFRTAQRAMRYAETGK